MSKTTIDLTFQHLPLVDIEEQLGDVRIPKYRTHEPASSSDDSSDDNTVNGGTGGSSQEKYRRKYIKLKRRIKDLVFENAALADETYDQQQLTLKYMRDRIKLLKRLVKYDKDVEKQAQEAQEELKMKMKEEQPNGPAPPKRKYRKRASAPATAATTPAAVGIPGAGAATTVTISTPNVVGAQLQPAQLNETQAAAPGPKKRGRKPGFKVNKNNQQQQQHPQLHQPVTVTLMPGSQVKVIEVKPVTSIKVEIKLDPQGTPICPFTVDGFTVYNLGHIIFQKTGYHTSNFIYPVGYHICRIYGHFKHPERKCLYYCRVLENGEFPKFEITAHEPEGKYQCRITGPSPDYCHTTLLQFINNANTAHGSVDIRPQGESFFGLSNPTIASFIQKLPNADKCRQFAPKMPRLMLLNTNTDASLNFDALQRSIKLPAYNIPEVKEEPPEDLFEI